MTGRHREMHPAMARSLRRMRRARWWTGRCIACGQWQHPPTLRGLCPTCVVYGRPRPLARFLEWAGL